MYLKLLRRLTGIGARRGLAGSRAWLAVAVAAGGLRLLRFVARDEPRVMYRTKIADGDRFLISTGRPK